MLSKILRAVAACTAVAICVITSNARATMVEQAKARISSSAARPALFELNTVDIYGNIPITFESNRGQFASRAKFSARGKGYAIFLGVNETTIALAPAARRANNASGSDAVVIGMSFAGANKAAGLVGEHALPTRSNYFIGPDASKHVTDVPHFGAVRQAGIYPGIDAVFYGNQQQLEYDLVVAPGADPRAIRLAFSGTKKITIDRDGNLVLQAAGGRLVQHRPFIYQIRDGERHAIAGQYVRRGLHFGIQVAAYDRQQPLIIDPVVSYATFLGGAKNDFANAIAVDATGNAYVTGRTASPRFPGPNGLDRRIGHNEQDVFVTKLNATGTAVIWTTYLGGAKGFDAGNGIAIDGGGNVYVAGTTSGTGFPTTAGAYQSTGSSFIAKINASGNALVYATYLAGTNIHGIAIDGQGNAFVTGSANSAFVATPGAFQVAGPIKTGAGNRTSAFVAKLNATGTAQLYGTFLGGRGTDEARGIALDGVGNVYIAGVTNSVDFPTLSAIQPYRGRLSGNGLFADDSNAFVTKINASGSALIYSTFLGGSYHDAANAIAIDAAGSAHITGTATSSDFPVVNAFQFSKRNSNPQITSAFVAKLTAEGNALVYSSYLSGINCPSTANCFVDDGDRGLAVTVDATGNAYYAGGALLTAFPVLFPIQPDNRQGGSGAFLAKISPAGQRFNTILIGGSGPAIFNESGDVARGVALDPAGNVYLAGSTTSINFPVTAGAFQTALDYNSRKDPSGVDAFVVKLVSPNYLVTLAAAPNPILANQTVALNSNVLLAGSPALSTGSVTFYDGSNALGSANVINGVAGITSPPLSVGIRPLTAVYGNQGDGSASRPTFVVVNPAGPCQAADSGTLPPAGAPLVVVTAPSPCQSFTAPTNITMYASAADANGRVVRVDYLANGSLIGQSTESNFFFNWSTSIPGTYAITAVATDNSGVSSTSTPVQITVTPANIAPTVSLTSPLNGATFRAGGSVALTANATDSDGSISTLLFLVDGGGVSSTNLFPYTGTWSNIVAGTHILTARATDNKGASTTSAPVTVSVAANNPPSVSLTAPAAAATFVEPASIAFAATASDSDGSVARVDFLLNANVVGSVISAPYTFTASNVAAGSYTATARATDNDGASTTSAAVSFTVAANQLPAVAITSPLNNASFTLPVNITITASATDSDGSIAKVEFFAGATLIGSVTTAPYSLVWQNPLPGSYTPSPPKPPMIAAPLASQLV